MTIKRQLFLLVTACVLPATIAGVLFVAYSYHRERAIIEQRTLETARALTQAVDRDLSASQAALQVLAKSPYLASGNLADFYRQAQQALVDMPGNNMVLSDASGQQLLNLSRPYGDALPRHGNPAQLRRVFETGRPAISDLFVGAVLRRPLITVDVPVRQGDQVVFDLSMGFFPDRLGEILARQHLPEGWVAVIFDSQGTIVARTHEEGKYVGRKGAPALVQRMTQVAEGHVETDTVEGIPVVAVFSRSAISHWTVAIGIPKTELASSLWIPTVALIAVASGLMALGIIVAALISSRISRSVRGLIPPAVALGRSEPVIVPPSNLQEADEVGQALVRASKVQQDREKTLAIVSHDLRSPLSAIMLCASNAKRLAENIPEGEQLRATATSIVDIARLMSETVDDLLAIAVSTSGGRSMLKIAPVNVLSLLERAAEAARPLFARKEIELEIEVAGTLPFILVDSGRILRVLTNLLDNALKFTERSGRVVVRAEEQSTGVRFCIANSGPALSAAEMENLFVPFWQAGRTDPRGAGLGLSICRSIIEAHGGSIWAEAEQGKCVRICFVVPSATPAASANSLSGPAACDVQEIGASAQKAANGSGT